MAILNLAFLKNNSKEEFHYQYALKNKRKANESEKQREIKLKKDQGRQISPMTQMLNH